MRALALWRNLADKGKELLALQKWNTCSGTEARGLGREMPWELFSC